MTQPVGRFCVVAVGDQGVAPPDINLRDAVDWYRHLSNGHWQPDPSILAPIRVQQPLVHFSAGAGGLASRGPNSQSLVAAVIYALPPQSRRRLGAAAGRLLLVVPGAFRPHVWHPPRGGIALGSGMWCRQFAVLPHGAPLGTIVHELGHLLLGWPDGDLASGHRCLMALGGHNGAGNGPAQPAAPILVDAGWRDPVPLVPELKISDLAALPFAVGVTNWRGHIISAELQSDRLLAWAGPPRRPHLLADMPIEGKDDLPVLGCLAQSLRKLSEKRSFASDVNVEIPARM